MRDRKNRSTAQKEGFYGIHAGFRPDRLSVLSDIQHLAAGEVQENFPFEAPAGFQGGRTGLDIGAGGVAGIGGEFYIAHCLAGRQGGEALADDSESRAIARWEGLGLNTGGRSPYE